MNQQIFVFIFLLVISGISRLAAGEKSAATIQAQSGITFEHQVLEDIDLRHPFIFDVDGDGQNDILTITNYGGANRYDHKTDKLLSWYQAPDWTRHDVLTFNYESCGMSIGDVDGDGDVDVIGRELPVGAADSAGITLWIENPRDPTKGPWPRHPIGRGSYIKEYDVADLNNDGKLDVVGRSHNMLYLWLQNSPQDWSARMIAIPPFDGLRCGDLDRDGDADVVLNGYWLETPANPLFDEWPLHNIDKKWYHQDHGSWADNNSKIALADIDQDGCLDVVISQAEMPAFPVSWYRAPVDPKQDAWVEHIIGQVNWCHSLEVADLDNDGDWDVAAGELTHGHDPAPFLPHKVVVFLNQGEATKWDRHWVWSENMISHVGIYGFKLGDLHDDGDWDIVGPRNFNFGPLDLYINLTSDHKLPLDKFTYFQIDSTRQKWGDWEAPSWLRYFGLDFPDVDANGYKDILAGRYFYLNPTGDLSGEWKRSDLGMNVDGILAVDVDGDRWCDVIATRLPEVYWFETDDWRAGSHWNHIKVAELPPTEHVNGQDYELAQIIPGGKPELLIASGAGTFYLEIPPEPEQGNWPKTQINSNATKEGIGVADIDGDGFLDIATPTETRAENGKQQVAWYKNPQNGVGDWPMHVIGVAETNADRCHIADLNADGRPDVVVTEERHPGKEPDASLFWFEAPPDPETGTWIRHHLVTQYSMNNLDVADLDRDGDADLIVSEHKKLCRLQIWENDGKGNFIVHEIDRGKESHLGAQTVDLDEDGDLDIVSIPWDKWQYLHVWRNDALPNPKLNYIWYNPQMQEKASANQVSK